MREMSPRERELRENWLADTSAAQAGVVTWAQLIQGGLTRADVQRKVRRRELRRVHPRVYVDHTGPLPWSQRAWAALLYAGMPSALCWESAQERAAEVDGPIHVAIEQSRRVEPQEGIVLHRMTGLQKRMFGGRPPRLRLEDNVLAMAHHAETDLDVVALLAGVVGRRGVTARSMRAALERFPTMRRHRFVAALLGDLEAGACSVLEHGYLVRVERAHGLPPAVRQSPRRTPEGRQLRDVESVARGWS